MQSSVLVELAPLLGLPLQAGSASDVAVRFVTERLSEALKQTVAVENVTGAAGFIGMHVTQALLARSERRAQLLEKQIHELAGLSLVEAELIEQRFGNFGFGQCHGY